MAQLVKKVKVKVTQLCPTLCDPMNYSPSNSPGQNTRMGSRSLLQGIFPAKGSNLGLPRCKWVLYQLSHLKNPPAVWETWVWSLGWEDPLENGTATHSNILGHLKNRKLNNFFGKHSSGFKWLNIGLPCDVAVPLLGTYLREMKTYVQITTCIQIFVAALFTIVKW